MRRGLSAFFLLFLLLAPAAFAQDAPPRYVYIFTAHVQLDHGPAFEQDMRSLWAALKKAEGSFPIFAAQSVSSPGDYLFVTTLSSMAALDAQTEVFNKAFAMNPQLGPNLARHSKGNSIQILAVRPDLSYVPEKPRLSEQDQNFARVTFLHAKPEHAEALEGLIKEFGELAAKKGIGDGYGVYQNVTGDGPVYAIRMLARSEADLYAQAAKNEVVLGEEAAAIRQRAGAMVDRISYETTARRQDLNFEP